MKLYSGWKLVCALVLILCVGGCRAPQAQAPAALRFEAQVEVNSGQEVHASLGVRNEGASPFAGDEAFDGQLELRYADGDRAGELRASAEIVALPALLPDETAWALTWRAELDPGAYTLTWGSEGYGTTVVEFEIVERDGRLYLES